jgi:hypothetical protein
MELHGSEHGSLFITWDGHIALVWEVVEIEGKAFVGKITLINESWEVIHRDRSIGKT